MHMLCTSLHTFACLLPIYLSNFHTSLFTYSIITPVTSLCCIKIQPCTYILFDILQQIYKQLVWYLHAQSTATDQLIIFIMWTLSVSCNCCNVCMYVHNCMDFKKLKCNRNDKCNRTDKCHYDRNIQIEQYLMLHCDNKILHYYQEICEKCNTQLSNYYEVGGPTVHKKATSQCIELHIFWFRDTHQCLHTEKLVYITA